MFRPTSKLVVLLFIILQVPEFFAQSQSQRGLDEKQVPEFRTLVTPQTLYDYVDTLSSDAFEGRLTGHEGYDKSATWLVQKLASWGIQPLGENDSYLQHFPHPYTEIFPGCEVIMHPGKEKSDQQKAYEYVEEFIPGSTSGNGEVTAEVIYAGYGITAPELGYDDYADLDVTGKIVLLEREAPVNTSHEDFLKWRPYSFHQYKLKNVVKHGAAGMLYNYHIANPNNAYAEGFVYSHIGETVMKDIFHETGREPEETVQKIRKELK